MSGCRKISALLNSYFVSVFSEEEGGDLLKSSFSFPGTPEEELGTDTSLRSPVLLVRGRGRALLRAQPSPGTEPAAGTAPPGATDRGQRTLSQTLLGIPHLLVRLENAKGNNQIWVTLRQPRIQKRVFKEIANLPSFVFFSLSCSLENILNADRVFSVTFSIWKNNRSKKK